MSHEKVVSALMRYLPILIISLTVAAMALCPVLINRAYAPCPQGVECGDVRPIPSPLQQLKMGIEPKDVLCHDGFVLVLRSDVTPWCIKEATVAKLVNRGVAKIFPHGFGTSPITDGKAIVIPRGISNPELDLSPVPKSVTLVIGVNNTVSWANEDDTSHALVADDGSWAVGKVSPGRSTTITFNQTGTYRYHGEPGPWIKGTITVNLPQLSKIPEPPADPSPTRLVFFINPDSVLKIYVKYVSDQPELQGERMRLLGDFYTGNPRDFRWLNSTELTIHAIPNEIEYEKANVTAVYTVSAKNATPGLYWFTLSGMCGAMPIAIGLDESQIGPSEIPVYRQGCPAQLTDSEILGISGGAVQYLQSTQLE